MVSSKVRARVSSKGYIGLGLWLALRASARARARAMVSSRARAGSVFTLSARNQFFSDSALWQT